MQLGTCVECGRQAARNSNKCPEHEAAVQARNRRGSSTWRIVLTVGVAVAIVVGVGYYFLEEFQPEPVSLEEYAARVCNADSLQDNATWGETRMYLQDRLSEHKGLAPPAEVVPYNEGRIAALEGFLDTIRDKDAKAIVNEYELIGNPDAMRGVRAGEAGERSLSHEHRRLLRQHGCRF